MMLLVGERPRSSLSLMADIDARFEIALVKGARSPLSEWPWPTGEPDGTNKG